MNRYTLGTAVVLTSITAVAVCRLAHERTQLVAARAFLEYQTRKALK